ncbi:DUF3667 domain-containing protein [Puia sp. P3]|uniref:DUF3667 domain-containing protein n=1 Tax=Puia sp. P3 TaxID=3423952 RepID=UPI003D67A0EF
MSHLKERKEKNCLNCSAEVVGRYCHVCGQENLEPKETVWHLIQHFFNDITHFDGKFFETVKFLMWKPGFLSKQYMAGRRMSYLNPIRMYVFTSAIFFIFLFSLKKPEDMVGSGVKPKSLAQLQIRQADLAKAKASKDDDDDDNSEALRKLNIQIAKIRKVYGDSAKRTFSKSELDELTLQAYNDSLVAAGVSAADRERIEKYVKVIQNPETGTSFLGFNSGEYKTVEEYDSAEQKLPEDLRDGWLKRRITHRLITLNEEYHADRVRFREHLIENVMHSFPKILFVSLPIFAMILNILYFRHKQYLYVDHGIFSIHLYCGTFILLLAAILLGQLKGVVAWGWLKTIVTLLIVAVVIYMLIYLYKAMRGFYQQRRAKTFLKYFIVCSVATVINIFLFMVFLVISAVSI